MREKGNQRGCKDPLWFVKVFLFYIWEANCLEHRRAMAVLFITLFLVMIGFGIVIPILPFLVISQQGTPATLGLLMATYSVMQFFFAPLWGRLSDRIGRRPILLLGLTGYGLSFILFGLATKLWMLFAARILAGVISSATLPTAMAYIADITGPDNRAKGMGLMGAAMGLGMIVGPALGGWLGYYGFAVPFFVAAALALVNAGVTYFLLPESMQQSRKTVKKVPLRLNLFHDVRFVLYSLSFIASFAVALFESTFTLFSADKLGFGPKEMGMVFTVLGVFTVVTQAGVVNKAVKRFGDIAVIIAGLIIASVGFALIITATDMLMLLLFTSFFSIGSSLLRPGISTLISKSAEPHEQGEAVGIMQSFDSLGRILGPATGGAVYDIDHNSPYLIGTVFLVFAIYLAKHHTSRFSENHRS
ncbi:MFS transporter [bacterium BFN5]|nr:MFS transporter [bacterium BFN5]